VVAAGPWAPARRNSGYGELEFYKGEQVCMGAGTCCPEFAPVFLSMGLIRSSIVRSQSARPWPGRAVQPETGRAATELETRTEF
jgi:hypothetical protein